MATDPIAVVTSIKSSPHAHELQTLPIARSRTVNLSRLYEDTELEDQLVQSERRDDVAQTRNIQAEDNCVQQVDNNVPAELALETQQSVQHIFPEGGAAAWLVVFGSASIIGVTFGLASSVGIFQEYWQTHQLASYSSSTIGWIGASNVSLCLLLGVQVGPLFDRYGPRWLMLSGSIAYVAGLVLLAECTQYWHFLLCFGVLCGGSAALIVTCAIAAVAHWFEAKRGKASGAAFVGSSIGGIAFPLLLRPLLEKLGWAWAIRALALTIGIFVVIGNLCVRGRLPKGERKGAIDLNCFRDVRFLWATVGTSTFEFVLFGALGLLPTFVVGKGWSRETAANVIATLNAGSAFGRYLAGVVSDIFGRYNSMVFTLIFSILIVVAFWIPLSARNVHSTVLLYIFAALYGFGSGSAISLAPVCFGQLCKASQYGQYYGTGYSIVSFATLICIPVSGALLPLGPEVLAACMAGVLCVGLVAFMMARWACLDWRWSLKVKI